MQELQNVVSTAFANIVASGAIEKAIEEKLQKTITEAIDGELRSYSDFGKAIGERIKQSLQINFDTLGLPGYNDLVLKIVSQQLEVNMSSALSEHIQERMTELLAPAPASINLSDLVAEFIKLDTERASYAPTSDEFTLIVKRDTEIRSMRFEYVYLDPDAYKSEYQCKYQIRIVDGVVSNVTFNDVDPSKKLFVGKLYGFERRLFQLYAAGTKLVLDDETKEISTYYPHCD